MPTERTTPDPPPSDSTGSGDAPLTFGQLSTWRSIETFAADRLAEVNVAALWDVTGFGAHAVADALRRLVLRHESLRTTYHTGPDGVPFQRVHADAPDRLERVEVPDAGAEDARQVLRALHARPFPVAGDLGRRAVLLTSRGRPHRLAVSLSHMVVDVWAVRILERELRELAAAPERDLRPAPVPRELALLQRGDTWAKNRRGAERYWRKVLAAAPPANLPAPPPRTSEHRVQATLRSRGLAAYTAAAADRLKVSQQSVLTTLTAAALAGLLGREQVTLSLMCGNRFDPRWETIVSTTNQLVPLVCPVPPGTPLGEFVKRGHLASLLAYRHGAYDVDVASALVAANPGPDGGTFTHDCWFNYVAEPPHHPTGRPACAPDAPATLTWGPPPRHAGHPFYVRVNSDGAGQADITLRVDPDLIRPAELVGVLRTVALGARQAATEPERTVGELLAAADGLPEPGLFPAPAALQLDSSARVAAR